MDFMFEAKIFSKRNNTLTGDTFLVDWKGQTWVRKPNDDLIAFRNDDFDLEIIRLEEK